MQELAFGLRCCKAHHMQQAPCLLHRLRLLLRLRLLRLSLPLGCRNQTQPQNLNPNWLQLVALPQQAPMQCQPLLLPLRQSALLVQ